MNPEPSVSKAIRREACPCCRSGSSVELNAGDMDAAPIRDYLQSAYPALDSSREWAWLTGIRFELRECAACGLIYQAQIPSEALLNRLYEHWIDPTRALARHAELDDVRRYSIYAQEILQLLAHFSQPPARLKFLDYGMGWGKWARLARAFGCDCAGFEISPSRIAHAQSHGVPVLSWAEIAQQRFDFINADQVFEHLPEPLETLRYLQQALKPTGLVRISVPDGTDIKRRLQLNDWSAPKGSRNSLEAVAPLEHINCFNRAALLHMAGHAGLTLAKLPLALQLTCTANWGSWRAVARNLLTPLRRDLFGRGTTLLLRPA